MVKLRWLSTSLWFMVSLLALVPLSGCDFRLGCQSDADCDDGLYCTGIEKCGTGAGVLIPFCFSSGSPCSNPLPVCVETGDRCVPCQSDEQCDDQAGCTDDSCDTSGECRNADNCEDNGIFCDGTPTCLIDEGECFTLQACANPTPACDETQDRCLPCERDDQCDDQVACSDDSCEIATGECRHTDNCVDNGIFCDGIPFCQFDTGECFASPPCGVMAPVCDEIQDRCGPCDRNDQCDDGVDSTVDTCLIDTGECSNSVNDGP